MITINTSTILEDVKDQIALVLPRSQKSQFKQTINRHFVQIGLNNLSQVWLDLSAWCLADPEWGLQQFAPIEEAIQRAVDITQVYRDSGQIDVSAGRATADQCQKYGQKELFASVKRRDDSVACWSGFAASAVLESFLPPNDGSIHKIDSGITPAGFALHTHHHAFMQVGKKKKAALAQASTYLMLIEKYR